MFKLLKGRGRGGRGGQRHRGGRGRRGYPQTIISDDIRSTLVDHAINHGLTMREAGHLDLSCFTISSVIRTFRLENRYVFNSQREKTLLVMLLRSCGQTPLTAGSISPPTHNSSVFRCLQYSSVFFVYFSLILLKLNLPHCNVQY